jgi:peptidoglycan/LPS O-acetylase OafA/YrhL
VNPARTLRAANRELDAMVANTPEHRDRYVDFLRVLAIGVVVAWHWSLSILYWSQDRWVMPNPIHEVPGGWAATWLLQIVTVFFVVGGYANGAAWWATAHSGAGIRAFYRARFQRLLVPVVVFLAVWAIFDLALLLLVPGYTGVLSYGQILFTPLWFIAAYLWVVLLVPLTATLHEHHKWLTLIGLAGVIAAADLGRFAAGWSELGWVNTALVWVFAHQLGYFFRDGTLDRLGKLGAAGLVVAAVTMLVGLTQLAGYPVDFGLRGPQAGGDAVGRAGGGRPGRGRGRGGRRGRGRPPPRAGRGGRGARRPPPRVGARGGGPAPARARAAAAPAAPQPAWATA